MTKFKTMSAIASLGLLMGAAAAPVAASQAQQPPAQAQPEIAPVSDAEVESYVQSVQAVGEIIEDVQPQLQQAQSEDQVSQLQASAQEAMVAAVVENGLTPERYNEINMAAQSDPALGQRISQVANQHMESTGQ